MNNTYQKYIDNILGEHVYIVNVDTLELVYINNDTNINSYQEYLISRDIPCLIDESYSFELDFMYKKYHYSEKFDIEYLIKYKLVELDDEKLLVHSWFDITEEVNGIKDIQDKLQVNNAIIQCANTLLKDFGASTNIKNLLEIVCNFYQGSRSILFLFNDDGATIKFIDNYSADTKFNELDKRKVANFPIGLWNDIIIDNNF